MSERVPPHGANVPAAEPPASGGANGAARSGPWWSPWAWWQILKAKWEAPGALTADEKRGFAFWTPVGLAIGGVELAGALSRAFQNAIPWPTISATIGHIESRWTWVGVIVVAVIAMVAYRTAAAGAKARRSPGGRAIPADAPGLRPVELKAPVLAFKYSWLFVFTVTAVVAALVALFVSDEKLVLGYSIYGSFLVFGIVVPSALARWAHREVGLPSLWLVVNALRERFRSTPMLVVAGLAILVVHLALYPWPDITRESTHYAGLTADAARTEAVSQIQRLRQGLPKLRYSTQTRGIAEGSDAWLVYFNPASGSGAAPYSGCVVAVAGSTATPSAECSK